MTNTKKCPSCEETKDTSEFYGRSGRRSDLSAYCKPCTNARGKAQRAALKYGGKEYDLKSTYNMIVEQYEALVEKQGGVCAICGGESEGGKHLSVDHDHKCCPGRKSCGSCVRGLLCNKCNQGIGYFDDDISKLSSALTYLNG